MDLFFNEKSNLTARFNNADTTYSATENALQPLASANVILFFFR